MAIVSFFQYSPTRIWVPEFTLSNYRHFLDPYYLHVMLVTVEIALLTTLTCAILAFPLAYFLARLAPKRLGLYLFILVSPLMVSSVIRAFGLLVLLDRRGLINEILQVMGLPPLHLLYNRPVVVIGLAEQLLPIMVLPLMAAIENIPAPIEEAAQILGATKAQVFFRVILPLSLPGLVSGCVLIYSLAMGALVVPAILGGMRVVMLGNLVYGQVLTALNWPFAAAIVMVLLFSTGLTMFAYIWSMGRLGRSRARGFGA